MRAIVRVGLSAILVMAGLAASDHAQADGVGDGALAAVDTAGNSTKTQYFEYEATHSEPGKAERKMGFNVWNKGEKMLLEFTAPADMKGTKVLVLSRDQMYVYLPAFGKVRRIASHMNDQGFMGMTFSVEDFGPRNLGSVYTATVAGQDAANWKLMATSKTAQTPTYPKLELTVDKTRLLPTEIRYTNAAGKLAKVETRTSYTCESRACTASEIKMVDSTKNSWTRLVRKKWKINDEMSDDLFSKRNLEK